MLLPALSNLLSTAASVAVEVFVILFATFFLLKDRPEMVPKAGPFVPLKGDLGVRWLAGVGRVLRGYIVGLTVLGAFNAVVVGLGALILGVPLIGTIVIITLLGNYIPYIGISARGSPGPSRY